MTRLWQPPARQANAELHRNIGLCPVCPAEMFSAGLETAGYKPAGRTDCKSMFRSRVRHLVIPLSFDIRHSSLSREMSVPRHRMIA